MVKISFVHFSLQFIYFVHYYNDSIACTRIPHNVYRQFGLYKIWLLVDPDKNELLYIKMFNFMSGFVLKYKSKIERLRSNWLLISTLRLLALGKWLWVQRYICRCCIFHFFFEKKLIIEWEGICVRHGRYYTYQQSDWLSYQNVMCIDFRHVFIKKKHNLW